MLSTNSSDYWKTTEKITQYGEYTQDFTCLKSKISATVFINRSVCRFKYINRFEYFKH